MARTVVRPRRPAGVGPAAATHPLRVEAWLLRALILAAAVFAVLQRQPWPALGAVAALVASFAPTLVSRGSGTRVPRVLELVWLVAVSLAGVSTGLMLYDRFSYWGKVVHGAEGFLLVSCFTVLLLGYRDLQALDVTDELAGVIAICAGIGLGVGWEIIEFIVDWVASTSLQKSNSDTMTDFLVNDVCTVIAALLCIRLYRHTIGGDERRELGEVATWMVDGPNRLLERHGHLMVFIAAAIIAIAVAILWYTGRPIPTLPAS